MRFIWIMDTNVSSPWYQNLNIRSRFLISYVGQKSRTETLALAENIWTGDVLNFFAAKEKFQESFCQSITSGSDKKDER